MASAEEKPAQPGWLDRLATLLTRETSSGQVIREIDGFRFLAIMAVIVFHMMRAYLITTNVLGDAPYFDSWSAVNAKSALVTIISAGFWGVQLFFVISGFVLALPYLDMRLHGGRAVRLGLYYLRRLVRIEPPFLLNLILLFLIICATKPYYRGYVPHLFATMAYSHFLVYGKYSLISGITWSLEVEAQFYLTMPLLAYVFRLRSTTIRRLVLVLAITLFGLLQIWILKHTPPSVEVRVARSLIYWLQYFLAGFLLADVYAAHCRGVRPRNAIWDAVGAVTAIVTFLIMLKSFFLWPLVPFLIAVFYFSVFRGPILNWLFTLRWVVVIGGMCYTLYLYHEAVINHLSPLVMPQLASLPLGPGFATAFAIIMAAILAVGGSMFILVEKPFMRLSSRLARLTDSLLRAVDWFYSKLSCITSTGEYIAEVDGLRFTSILAVMLASATYYFTLNRIGRTTGGDLQTNLPSGTVHVLWQGYAGTLLFFGISGFAIGLPFARAWLSGKRRPNLLPYYLRRLIRIEPPYLLNITFCFLAFGGLTYLSTRVWPYLTSIAYVHNIAYAGSNAISIVAWTLEVQVQFYLLAPLLAYVFAVRPAFWRRLILLAGMAAFGVLTNVQGLSFGPVRMQYTLINYLGYFLAGFLLADLYETAVVRRMDSLTWDAISILAAAALAYVAGWQRSKGYWLLPFLILLICVGGFQGRMANWFLTRRFIVTVGGMCYTLYLWHSPLLIMTSRWFAATVPRELPFQLQVVIADAISIVAVAAVCPLLFYYTERPFMGNRIAQWITGKWRGFRTSEVATPAES
jgi:peptidoglycan/LPS O-acetylase OafA/YrhL